MSKQLQLLIDQASSTTTSYFDGRGNITSTHFDKEKFAALVEAKARAAEREACAKVCEVIQAQWLEVPSPKRSGYVLAEAIRARGETK